MSSVKLAFFSGLGLLAILFGAVLHAETLVSPSFVVREWHREDGLPAEVVSEVSQDRDGYLWFAAGGELVRFDGRNFKVQPSIPGGFGQLLAMQQDKDDWWLAPRSGNLFRWRAGVVTPQPLPAPYTGRPITNAFLAPDRSEWIVLRDQIILHRSGEQLEVFDSSHGFEVGRVTRFASDQHGRTWICSGTFLGRYEAGKITPTTTLPLPESELRLASSRRGGPWVITEDRVLKLDSDDQPETVAPLTRLISAHYVTAACEDRSGALWLGTRSQGVHRVTRQGTEHVPTSNDTVNALYEDAEGTIWVATNAGGLNAIGPKFHHLYDRSSGLLANNVNAITDSPDGTIWCANGDGGIARIFEDHTSILPQDETWPKVGVISVSASADTLWFSGTSGVYQWPADAQMPPRLVADTTGWRTFVDAGHALWFSGEAGRVGRWSKDKLTLFDQANGLPAGEDIRCFAVDQSETLWVGSAQGHLLHFVDNRFAAMPLEAPIKLGPINAIHFEDDQTCWLAMARGGIAIARQGHVKILGTAAGLPDDNVTQFVADDHGFLWCGSGSGIFRLSRDEVRKFSIGEITTINPVRLGRDEGLRLISCTAIYAPGALKARDGRIWFATRQGALAIDPASAFLASRPQRVTIESVRVDGQPLAQARPLEVSSQMHKLQFEFSVLCLSTPRHVQTQYRLDGLDTEWLPAGNSTIASYARLPPGNYAFRVRAVTGLGAGEQIEDSVLLTVPRPWWQQGITVGTALCLLVGGVAVIARAWSTRRLRRRLEGLQREHAIERERARIARNIHDDVGASLTHISLLTQTTRGDHAPEQLQRIHETTREITRSLDEIVWAIDPQHDTLESFAGYLGSYAQRYLQAANIRCRLEIPEQLPTSPLTSQMRHDLFLCCREALHNVVKHAHASAVTLRMGAESKRLTISIEDDGVGLGDPGKTSPPGSGNGLRNMDQRMQALGGSFRIAPNPARGARVTLSIPLS